ncbi:Gag-Pol polyprotein [Gossypium australe]|uniref:Gag-Pol polyprotein n=1 Tax=Gossypium australe TaxID=47621 RepID=A0A5B6VM19_9ROSI|nr:Gag-Pol polyprotein [Gossypium australe]
MLVVPKATSLSVDGVKGDMWENAGESIIIELARSVDHEITLFEIAQIWLRKKMLRIGTTNTAVRSEAGAPVRAYAIRAQKEASSPDVITGTFTLFDTDVIALIDPGFTHSYVCVNLVSSKTLPVESTKIVIRVSNPLGKCVLVDKVCKN